MAKVLLKWPIELDANGQLAVDQGPGTPLRISISVFKATVLGRPNAGLSAHLLEQLSFTDHEDRAIALATIVADIQGFSDRLTVLRVSAFRDTERPRTLIVSTLVEDPESFLQSFLKWRLK